MAKKILSAAALWLMLLALVFLYTDRSEYTWTFEGGELARVLVSARQAQENEAAAQQAMALEKEQARAREGMWDQDEQYGGAPKTRKAVDETLGLNLMWGAYEVTVSYASPQALDLRTVSALRQMFIEDGEKTLPAMDGAMRFSFTLTDACEQVAFAMDVPEDAQIRAITVHKAGAGVLSRDLAAYAALAGAVLTALLTLSWDTRPVGRQRRRDALAVVAIALFASMPLLFSGIYDGHDLFFHLNRIEGIASGLRAGQFPVRIHASTLLGYGYAAPQFYPELFLYIPAVLRNLGVSLAASVRVFELMINLATAAVCYFSARGVFHERRIALGATALYTLCSYRISNLYVRATLGESLAMIFFPLLLFAMVEVLTRDERRWPLLALAMTGIFMSHLLSTLFAAALCALAALLCAKRLIREPRRILACAKAALLFVLCSAWFLVPFLDFARAGINTSVAVMAGEHVLRPGAFFVGFPGQNPDLPYEATDFAYTVGVVPGLALMLGCGLLLAHLYMNGRRQPLAQEDRLCGAFLALSGLLLAGATALFPVYAAFAQAVYPEDTRYTPYNRSDSADSLLTCSKTDRAYKRLIYGNTDVIFCAQPSDEELQMAKEAGVTFELTPIGYEAFVFIVPREEPVTGLTTQNIRDIYRGAVTDWVELGIEGLGKIVAYQRPENSGSQTALEEIMGDLPLMDAPGYVVDDMVGIVDNIEYRNLPGAIGYSFRYFVSGMMESDVRMLAIDGVEPTLENIRNGSYPFISTLYAVTRRGEANPNVQTLLSWLTGDTAQRLLEASGYVGLN